MRICYVLLSPTFGMHQYTADLANRAAAGVFTDGREHTDAVHLITTTRLVRDRYSPHVQVHTPVTTSGTGFALEGIRLAGLGRVVATIDGKGCDTVHITGVHAWNVLLVHALRRQGIRVIHTLHDLNPHHGVRFPRLIRLWNRLVIASVDHLLVHGQCYRDRLLAIGVPAEKVTCVPLLHLFLSYDYMRQIEAQGLFAGYHGRNLGGKRAPRVDDPKVLFFGRVEAYKGVDILLSAWEQVMAEGLEAKLIVAGPVAPGTRLPSLPMNVELRNRWVRDAEALDLFRSASLIVLPYRDASQSALVAAAYYFGVPVIVTATGALPEYVVEGRTGWVVPPNDDRSLASALVRALTDLSRLHRMGQEGQNWYHVQRRIERLSLSSMYEVGKSWLEASSVDGSSSGRDFWAVGEE